MVVVVVLLSTTTSLFLCLGVSSSVNTRTPLLILSVRLIGLIWKRLSGDHLAAVLESGFEQVKTDTRSSCCLMIDVMHWNLNNPHFISALAHSVVDCIRKTVRQNYFHTLKKCHFALGGSISPLNRRQHVICLVFVDEDDESVQQKVGVLRGVDNSSSVLPARLGWHPPASRFDAVAGSQASAAAASQCRLPSCSKNTGHTERAVHQRCTFGNVPHTLV